MDRYSTGSTVSKHDIIDAFKVVDLVTKDNLIIDNTNDNNDSTIIEEPTLKKIETASDITEQILMETKIEKTEQQEIKSIPKKEDKQETAKVSLKEIDDRLMTIDDFLGDF